MYGSNNAVESRASNTSTRPHKPNGTEGTGLGQGSTVSARRQVDTDTENSVPQPPRAWQKRRDKTRALSPRDGRPGWEEQVLVGRGGALSAAPWGPHSSEKPPRPLKPSRAQGVRGLGIQSNRNRGESKL